MRVTLVIYGLGGGGAERVMSIVANYWVSKGWEVTLILLVPPTTAPFYQLDARIKLKSLGVAGKSASKLAAISKAWQRIQVLRREIIDSKPDVVISFMNSVNVYTIIACVGLNIPTIVSEHIYPGRTDASKVWQLIMKWAYRYADLVTVLTQNALPFYPATKGYQTIVMPNPIVKPEPVVATTRLVSDPSLIAIGRLHPQKGFDLLIKAFDQIQAKYPDWQITILGEGPMRSELEGLRSTLKLNDRVHLPGLVTNVPEYLQQADIFVMPSRFEGFPMALCEAMAAGLPVLATNCLSGPSEIVDNGVNGILVTTENVDALAAGLDSLMSNPTKRQQLAQNAPQILDRFGVEQVMKIWQDAINRVIARRQR